MNEVLMPYTRLVKDTRPVFPSCHTSIYASIVFACTLTAISLIALTCCSRFGMDKEAITTYARAKDQYLAGEYDKAIAIVTEGRFNYGTGHHAYLLQAKCEFLNRKPDRAEAILRKLIRVHPRYAEAGIWLVRSILAQGRIDEAETEAERAMEWNPEDPRILSLMGSIQDAKREYQKSFEYYARSTGFTEETGKDEIHLAELYWRFGQTDKALECIRLSRTLISPLSVLYRPLDDLEERMKKDANR